MDIQRISADICLLFVARTYNVSLILSRLGILIITKSGRISDIYNPSEFLVFRPYEWHLIDTPISQNIPLYAVSAP